MGDQEGAQASHKKAPGKQERNIADKRKQQCQSKPGQDALPLPDLPEPAEQRQQRGGFSCINERFPLPPDRQPVAGRQDQRSVKKDVTSLAFFLLEITQQAQAVRVITPILTDLYA